MRETLNCVTDQEFLGYQETDNLNKMLFKTPAVIEDRDGELYYLLVSQTFTVIPNDEGGFRAHSREYSYVLSTSDDYADHGIVSYHWHPHLDSEVRDPHLHLHIERDADTPLLERLIPRVHFPTSRVCLEDFIWMLIRYYRIKPLHTRWRSVLKRNKMAFSRQATWFVAHHE
jgi:hypothetical protein